MNKPMMLRYVYGHAGWTLVAKSGELPSERNEDCRYGTPSELFYRPTNAPPDDATPGDIWEWRGWMTDDDDVGVWLCVGSANHLIEGEK